jgi:prevent-host-death family protein
MIRANVHEAKSQLSKLIERAEAGEEVVIARNGRPVVRLVPLAPGAAASTKRQVLGALRDKVWTGSADDLAEADRQLDQAFSKGDVFPPARG